MSEIDRVIERIRAYRETEGLTRSALALRAGLHKNTLRGMDEENWNPPVETVRKLEALLPEESEPVPPAGDAAPGPLA